MSRFYLSGEMRGIPDHNFPAFRKAAAELRAQGHDILDPSMSFVGETLSRTEYLRHDIQLLLVVDGVVVLEGWESSPGARLEVAVAWSIGIPVYEFSGGVLVPTDSTSVTIPREDKYLAQVPLIGLSGFAQAGKDAVANVLVSQGWTRVAFADPLKSIACELGWSGEKDEHGRRLLQGLGVGVREHLNAYAWVDRAEHSIELAPGPVVLTDVRFQNESKMVRRRGGKIVRVVRPGVGPVNDHVSEFSIGDSDADCLLHNDGSLADLEWKIDAALEGLRQNHVVTV